MYKCLFVYSVAVCLWGADAQPTPSAPQPIKIGGITISGNLRTRVEDWSFFQGDGADNAYAYSGNLLRVSLSQSRETLDWQLEFAAPFLFGLPDHAVAAGTPGQLGFGASYYVANNKSPN